MSIGTAPGLVTDELLPFGGTGLTYPDLVKAGFEWVTYLTYNPQLWEGGKGYDLNAVKAHGFKSVGVWGVIYSKNDFYHGGKAIAEMAVALKAQNCMINCEEIYKNTREKHEGKEIINGVRAGGWMGAVSLITYGAPWTPLVNDYAMDEKSFTNTGGSIIPEAYYNESEGYEPIYCKQYLDRLKIPPKQQNYMLGLYPGRRGKVIGASWVDLLKKAKIGKNYSIYMIQHLDKSDVNAFAAFNKVPIPPITTAPTAAQTRSKMIDDAKAWLEGTSGSHDTARIKIAQRIVGFGNTDPKWNAVRDTIMRLLDSQDIP